MVGEIWNKSKKRIVKLRVDIQAKVYKEAESVLSFAILKLFFNFFPEDVHWFELKNAKK